jgi:hypothetical protein
MFGPGKRAFSIGSIALIVVAGLHTMGHFAPPPQDPAWLALDAALRDYTFELPLMPTTAFAVLQSLSLTMTVTLLALGALGLVAARSCDAATVRRFAIVETVAVAALVAIYAVYRVSPPLVTLALVLVAFTVAALPTQRTS